MRLLHSLQNSINRRKANKNPANRKASVKDYEGDAEKLRQVLLMEAANEGNFVPSCCAINARTTTTTSPASLLKSPMTSKQNPPSRKQQQQQQQQNTIEWRLPNAVANESEPQTMQQELKRLQVLHSYCILDSQQEDEFDRITRVVSATLQAPVCFINLIDLSRQWTKSSSTPSLIDLADPDQNNIGRDVAICSHVVINKLQLLVIPDTLQDERFKDSPFAKNPQFPIRFYAGAALVAPEGVKLGSLCIVDTKPRPEGLLETHQCFLLDMAAVTVQAMVARRTRLLHQAATEQLQVLGKTVLAPMAQQLQIARLKRTVVTFGR